MPDQPLINKFRPEDFDQVIGHQEILASLQRAIASSVRPHAYLFTGPAGLGKTTLARIVGKHLQAEIVEVDAASNSGVDAMRAMVEFGAYMPIGGAGRRIIIIDECHTLSKPAFQAALKILEEPPSHLFIALCTTELAKIPETIVSRCFHVMLRPLRPTEIEELLIPVCEIEEWQVADDVLAAVVQAAEGSPRKALTILQAVHDVTSRDEVKRIITLIDSSKPLLELLQLLMRCNPPWGRVRDILKRIEPDEFENASIEAGRYICAAMVNEETSDDRARQLWILLDALLFPAHSYDRLAMFYAAIGRMIWGGGL
jgi:DNA polymerase III subunit gamma/tau